MADLCTHTAEETSKLAVGLVDVVLRRNVLEFVEVSLLNISAVYGRRNGPKPTGPLAGFEVWSRKNKLASYM